MIENPFPIRLQAGVTALLEIIGDNSQAAHETRDQFSVELHPTVKKIDAFLGELRPYADLFTTSLEYTLNQELSGSIFLTNEGFKVEEWPDELDPDQFDDSETAQEVEELIDLLSQDQETFDIQRLSQKLDHLDTMEVVTNLTIFVSINKNELIRELGFDDSFRVLLYILTDKFVQLLSEKDLPAVYSKLMPESKQIFLVMLGDTLGQGIGPNLLIYGRDVWTDPELTETPENKNPADISEVISFRSNECYWEIAETSLTPFHLHLGKEDLSRKDLVELFKQLQDRLCVVYLADRTKEANGKPLCEFRGQKLVQVEVPTPRVQIPDNSIFALFKWAYENHSSDKVGIVRQIVSLTLEGDAKGNYNLLLTRANELLGTAKSNFQLFLKRSVELYFDKRLRVSEYLHKFSEEVGAGVSALTSDLISNVYRTIGIILGVILASLLETELTSFVAALSAILYLFYIAFIFFIMLPSTYSRFRGQVLDYRYNVSELRDVLSEEEISRLEGGAFERARRQFLLHFGLVNVLYATLGSLTYLLARYLWSLQ